MGKSDLKEAKEGHFDFWKPTWLYDGKIDYGTIYIIRRLMEFYKDKKKDLYIVFINMEKTSNRISRERPILLVGIERVLTEKNETE